jgi:hypothetical protein
MTRRPVEYIETYVENENQCNISKERNLGFFKVEILQNIFSLINKFYFDKKS